MDNFFALIIGVGGDLAATAADASAVHALLSDPLRGGYPAANITLLVDEDSSKEKVLNALDELIAKTDQAENATVVVYYSGHGLQFPQEENPNLFDYYLKTSGADKTRKEETMVNGLVFSKKINRIKAARLLILLDCCHADGLGPKRIDALEEMTVQETSSNRGLLEKLTEGEGRVFISACDDDEESVILPGSKNSLFTEVCLEALHGKLSPADEFVPVIDLMYFVVKEVPKRVLPFHHKQRPIITEVQNLSPDYFVCRNGDYKTAEVQLEDFIIDNSAERLLFLQEYDNKL
ncbi:caspase family protein [Kaistella palustris]|uniref:caspase family protein n=1 Tax=Kaistella palustris TaxID=493376 RepID=UPI0004058256|nr:caspase family protein [Kaistella palustris]